MKLGCVILIALCTWNAWAQFAEPPAADTLRTDSLSAWPDTSVALSDSMVPPPHATLHHGWLYHMGVMMITMMGFMMLFTMRSR